MAGSRRRRPVRAALLLAVLLVGACGVEPQRSPEPVPADRLPVAGPSPSPTADGAVRGRVWGARDSRLVPVFVELPDGRTTSRVQALLELSAPEQRPPTALRPGTRLTGIERRGDLVVLELSEELERVPERELPLALGQLVFTITEQAGIRRVHVRSGGAPVRYVDATGDVIGRALARPDFADLVEAEDVAADAGS